MTPPPVFAVDVVLVEIEEGATLNEIEVHGSTGGDHGAHFERPPNSIEGMLVSPDLHPVLPQFLRRHEKFGCCPVAPIFHIRTAGKQILEPGKPGFAEPDVGQFVSQCEHLCRFRIRAIYKIKGA